VEETVKVTGPNEELEAMKAVADALAGVDATSARRVLKWAAERFGVALAAPRVQGTLDVTSPQPGVPDTTQDLATFMAEAGAESGPERALAVGYYQQVVQGAQDLDAQALNAELKHLGHGLSNVTATLSLLINQKPNLLIQTKKMGSGQQARKRYRLTNAGMVRVREMLARAKPSNGQED
jgi:hypothetical protein